MGLLNNNNSHHTTGTTTNSTGLGHSSGTGLGHSSGTGIGHSNHGTTGLGSSNHSTGLGHSNNMHSGNGPALGTTHGNHGIGHSDKHVSSHTTTGTHPSMGQKLAGNVDVLVGKATNNPHKVLEGELKKGNNVAISKTPGHL
ncbi:hypothetical protein BDY24DRAFT_382389 [Mrakia frigida]|uniref:uncharacterized protein n=1 Tax=Mrakia frigida TaxID=29902 RepID=UPI003FCBEE8C